MDYFILDTIAFYAPNLMEAILYAVAIIMAIMASKYVKPLLRNKVVEVLAKNAVLFVEQTYKDLHGEQKLNMALEALSEALAKYKVKISASEMKLMIEAAVAKFNNVFSGTANKLTE